MIFSRSASLAFSLSVMVMASHTAGAALIEITIRGEFVRRRMPAKRKNSKVAEHPAAAGQSKTLARVLKA
jgi:hypothetical protein